MLLIRAYLWLSPLIHALWYYVWNHAIYWCDWFMPFGDLSPLIVPSGDWSILMNCLVSSVYYTLTIKWFNTYIVICDPRKPSLTYCRWELRYTLCHISLWLVSRCLLHVIQMSWWYDIQLVWLHVAWHRLIHNYLFRYTVTWRPLHTISKRWVVYNDMLHTDGLFRDE